MQHKPPKALDGLFVVIYPLSTFKLVSFMQQQITGPKTKGGETYFHHNRKQKTAHEKMSRAHKIATRCQQGVTLDEQSVRSMMPVYVWMIY